MKIAKRKIIKGNACWCYHVTDIWQTKPSECVYWCETDPEFSFLQPKYHLRHCGEKHPDS